jgi:hypothetical protein
MRNQWLSAPEDLACLCLCILNTVNTSATDHCLRLVPISMPRESVCMLKKPRNSCTQASILSCKGHIVVRIPALAPLLCGAAAFPTVVFS